jgi:hypothetical protein
MQDETARNAKRSALTRLAHAHDLADAIALRLGLCLTYLNLLP